MAHATWNGTTVAESDDIVEVEGNLYFPRESVDDSLLEPSDTTSVCPWKGTANYFTLLVDGERNPDAVWTYENPLPAARQISDRVAFWRGVTVER
jgi:uncharacterized protein (DUF427 family)